MENTNYYEKLGAEYPRFNSLQINEERQRELLKSQLRYSYGAISTLRDKANELKADTVHSESRKAELLAETKTKLQATLAQEFKPFEDRVTAAEQALHSATHEARPKDTVEELLQFMKGKELRDSLAAMPLAKGVEFTLNTAQNGDPSVLRAVESQPITSNLIPEDVLQRANTAYASKVAPQRVVELEMAKSDLDKATLIKSLTQIELDYLEQGL
ncbi:MAG: hypothetical protein C4B58_05275 [Deltaproteobacteria bacterium]|nr:MAG: hypothetical protein C4B58_05275 [Deltaproteobacteria bacterium]